MRLFNRRIAIAGISMSSLLVAYGCSTQKDYRASEQPPVTVQTVDLDRYAGKWFEIARYPNGFQENCEDVTAEYAQREDGRISVINTCHSGEPRSAEGVARVVDPATNAKLEVKFAPSWVPFAWGDYWILHLEEDYSAALVGDPAGKYLWILAREPHIPEDTLARIISKAEELGYATGPLKMTKHTKTT